MILWLLLAWFPGQAGASATASQHLQTGLNARTQHQPDIEITEFRKATELDPQLADAFRSEEHTSELQSHLHIVCRLLLEKKTKHRPPDASKCNSPTHQGYMVWPLIRLSTIAANTSMRLLNTIHDSICDTLTHSTVRLLNT